MGKITIDDVLEWLPNSDFSNFFKDGNTVPGIAKFERRGNTIFFVYSSPLPMPYPLEDPKGFIPSQDVGRIQMVEGKLEYSGLYPFINPQTGELIFVPQNFVLSNRLNYDGKGINCPIDIWPLSEKEAWLKKQIGVIGVADDYSRENGILTEDLADFLFRKDNVMDFFTNQTKFLWMNYSTECTTGKADIGSSFLSYLKLVNNGREAIKFIEENKISSELIPSIYFSMQENVSHEFLQLVFGDLSLDAYIYRRTPYESRITDLRSKKEELLQNMAAEFAKMRHYSSNTIKQKEEVLSGAETYMDQPVKPYTLVTVIEGDENLKSLFEMLNTMAGERFHSNLYRITDATLGRIKSLANTTMGFDGSIRVMYAEGKYIVYYLGEAHIPRLSASEFNAVMSQGNKWDSNYIQDEHNERRGDMFDLVKSQLFLRNFEGKRGQVAFSDELIISTDENAIDFYANLMGNNSKVLARRDDTLKEKLLMDAYVSDGPIAEIDAILQMVNSNTILLKRILGEALTYNDIQVIMFGTKEQKVLADPRAGEYVVNVAPISPVAFKKEMGSFRTRIFRKYFEYNLERLIPFLTDPASALAADELVLESPSILWKHDKEASIREIQHCFDDDGVKAKALYNDLMHYLITFGGNVLDRYKLQEYLKIKLTRSIGEGVIPQSILEAKDSPNVAGGIRNISSMFEESHVVVVHGLGSGRANLALHYAKSDDNILYVDCRDVKDSRNLVRSIASHLSQHGEKELSSILQRFDLSHDSMLQYLKDALADKSVVLINYDSVISQGIYKLFLSERINLLISAMEVPELETDYRELHYFESEPAENFLKGYIARLSVDEQSILRTICNSSGMTLSECKYYGEHAEQSIKNLTRKSLITSTSGNGVYFCPYTSVRDCLSNL
ncbi:MAG: hypothetical protein NDI94_05130 [Candidatus Woesearchaeota archaeon]|nr:hypothetical protein [Candidatus Woesearchaeota archaeon]